jgi:GT2 family glycosyltransferase
MAYSRAVFERFAFDENLTGYGYMEDVDFSSRVGRNFRLLYCPQAELEHHPSTFRDYDAVALRRMMIRHHVYLYRKNLPKTAVHLAAFVWSLLGTLAYNALLSRDLQACRGVLHGLFRK